MNWKDFLQTCNEEYSVGYTHVVTFDEVEVIKRETGIILEALAPVTDYIYDEVYYQCKKLFPNDPFFNKLTSVNSGYGEDITLSTPAGSLDECKLGELQKWIDPDQDYVVSEKLDGCSIILSYVNGRLTQCITRGDGYKGKNVTRHVAPLVPILIDNEFTGMIRGELICPKEYIQNMIDDLKVETRREYKNGRNTVAGFLNSKETLKSVTKYARVVVYSIMDSNKPQSEQFQWLNLYFNYIASNEIFHGSEITEAKMIERVNWYHSHGLYETDGIVVTLDQFGKIEYETNSINPKNARKFKVINDSGETEKRVKTKVENITWQVSKSGAMKPVLQLTPVDINGVTISNVTGNNYTWIVERQCGIGSEVEVIRSNSVIPKIVNILSTSTNYNEPANTHKEGVDLVLNDKDTFEVSVKKLVHLAQTLDLDQAGEASMEKLLIDYPELKNPVEIFGLTLRSFRLTLGLNGAKLFESLKRVYDNGITKSKLADACGCFDTGLGESLLSQIEQKYGNLILLTEDIDNFGPARIKQYNDNFSNWTDTESIYTEKHGGKFISVSKKQSYSEVYTPTGVRFKPEQKQKLDSLGIGVNDSLSKSTTCLVVKDLSKRSSKMDKAEKMGIQIKTYDNVCKELGL